MARDPGTQFEDIIRNGPFPIRFPKLVDLDQDEEWCEVEIDGQWKKIRFHDYNEVFAIPGLYETIFYRTLLCNSPHRMTELLGEVLAEQSIDPQSLRVLDFGAGNGMSGEALHTLGVRKIIAADILPEAKAANWRDRPWVYYDYLIADFTQLGEEDQKTLEDFKINSLVTVAALGYGDIPPKAFETAYNLVEAGGWLGFNIKADFLSSKSTSGFSALINRMIQDQFIEVHLYKRYQHRLNIAGEPLFYIGLVAKKLKQLPPNYA